MDKPDESPIRITTLGTSHGDQTYCRFNSSTLIEVGRKSYLVDAGAPVEALLIRSGKPFENLKAVFLTHMHNDHVGGLPGLIKAFIKRPKEGQFAKIFLPEELGVEGLSGWLKAQHLPYPSQLYSLHTIKEGPVFKDNTLSVHAVGTYHLNVDPKRFSSYAFIIEAQDKRIVYTGDLSADFSDFPQIARDEVSDLCICESTHFQMEHAIEVLRTCPIKKLVFNHVSNQWHGEGEAALMQMLKDMPFPCAVAHDGDVFTV